MSAPWIGGLRIWPEDTILVACECSGSIRDALLEEGYPAVSCDMKTCEVGGPHVQCDVRDIIGRSWRGLIAHPVCTIMANSGSKHLYIGMKKENGPNPERWEKLREAADFALLFENAEHIERRAWENPIIHEHAAAMIGRRQNFVTQPWHHGEPEFKATCWWTHNLPDLEDTDRLVPPKPGTDEHKRWSRVHREPPGPERAANRSRTLPGPARAIARQWGPLFGTPIAKPQADLFQEAA